MEGEYGGGAIRLDLARVRLAKEVKDKDRRIEELTQQQVVLSILRYVLTVFSFRKGMKLS